MTRKQALEIVEEIVGDYIKISHPSLTTYEIDDVEELLRSVDYLLGDE